MSRSSRASPGRHLWSGRRFINGAYIGPYSVAIDDLDGNQVLDLAVANSSSVSILLGLGDGTFEAAVHYNAGDELRSVAIDDLNGDGALDLAVANSLSDDVSVLLGNGDGTFQTRVNYGAGDGSYSVAIGDLDGDFNPDLAVSNIWSNNISVLLGNGDGTFQNAENYGSLIIGHGRSPSKTLMATVPWTWPWQIELATISRCLSTGALRISSPPS